MTRIMFYNGAKTLSLTTLRIMTLSILINCDTQRNNIQHNGSVVMLDVTYKPFMLNVMMLSVDVLNVVSELL